MNVAIYLYLLGFELGSPWKNRVNYGKMDTNQPLGVPFANKVGYHESQPLG